ncbi:hypothetical protein [Archaeoglobus profundus]|uniref:Uncharacterized protein n=1 Tax=Archaeoglobus profundus (strain DSM 5631 / JCM 9629 / NBRC 100127 / Av18) TaxID=572546 RepID=D2RDJ2_ARCPA|nr:hypothetical protein [Archaeoglobus profundus]ADB58186.1 hypothetical protein Arcpr_1128 [Archaeoglobus profundus DSM 5631]
MERIEALEKSLGEVIKAVKTIAEELKELKQEAQQGKKAKPASLKLHKTAFKVKNSKYNNGSKIVIVEKGKESIAFALNKDDWLKLREFLDSYFGIGNGSQKSYSKRSYGKKSYGKKAKPAVEVEEVEGYENALDEE